MINLRIFSEQGIKKFQEYIQELKDNSQTSRLDLNVEPHSIEFQPGVDIGETRVFPTRMELGRYLSESFTKAGINRADVIGKRELWTWIAYLWFDQLCPVLNKVRNVRETARYICTSDYRNYYRHYIAASYDIYSLHGNKNSRLFLYSPLYVHNDFIEQIASRQYIISNRSLVDVAHRLYWDAHSNSPKRGSQTRNKPGNHRRFVRMVGQLELTYDIYSMTPDEILNLLPEEFAGWKNLGN